MDILTHLSDFIINFADSIIYEYKCEVATNIIKLIIKALTPLAFSYDDFKNKSIIFNFGNYSTN